MDNLTHTLVGLALAESGLKRTSRFGTGVLVVGANLPDLDGLTYFLGSGTFALTVRRGWTHGVLAMALLPPLLTAATLGWGRLAARRGGAPALPVRAGWLLTLSCIGIWSHPLLDLLNTYGVRLLMPFSGRWYYGDTLFILDPWMWVMLALGIVLSRRAARRAASPEAGRRAGRSARVALAAAVVYAVGMAAASRAGRAYVERRSTAAALRTMVAPVPGTPFRRDVIRDLGGAYEFGALTLAPWSYSRISVEPTGGDSPAARAAAATPVGSRFLRWARFPRFVTRRQGDSVRVIISDARYARPGGGSWASVMVTLPAGGG